MAIFTFFSESPGISDCDNVLMEKAIYLVVDLVMNNCKPLKGLGRNGMYRSKNSHKKII